MSFKRNEWVHHSERGLRILSKWIPFAYISRFFRVYSRSMTTTRSPRKKRIVESIGRSTMNEKDKNKTAFFTPQYEFNWMPFGLKNAPAIFQRLMNAVLAGIQRIRCLVYLDDIMIYGSSLQKNNKRLTEILQRSRKHNLKLQVEKCKF